MKRTLVILSTLSLIALTPAAYAQAPQFSDFDTNQDGQLTLEEVQAILPDFTEEDFAAVDADQSGTLSQDEFDSLDMSMQGDAPAN